MTSRMSIIVDSINQTKSETAQVTAGSFMRKIGEFIGKRAISTRVPEILKKHATIIPQEIVDKTSFTGVASVTDALTEINQQTGVKQIIFTDIDGPLASFGGVVQHNETLNELSGKNVIAITNRQESLFGTKLSFPGTQGLKKWIEAAGIPVHTGMDQQNPFNDHNNPQFDAWVDRVATLIGDEKGPIAISLIHDVLNAVPPTWNDFVGPGISNAFILQLLTLRLKEHGIITDDNLPQINLYGVSPLFKNSQVNVPAKAQ